MQTDVGLCSLFSLHFLQINDDCFDYVIETGFDNCTLQKRYCPKEQAELPANSTFDYIDPECKTFFNLFNLEDWAVGLILLIMSLLTMILALIFMVKLLNVLLQGILHNFEKSSRLITIFLNRCHGCHG